MRALSQAELLDLWESGQGLHPIDQGLLAIHAAFPETHAQSVADWPLGRRNRALAQLRCACFGTRLAGWTACRQCGEALEFELDARAMADSGVASDVEEVTGERGVFRLPTSRDLAAVALAEAHEDAARTLLDQCRVGDADATYWSDEDIEAIGEQLALADPLAEILLDFACPVCGESFQESLDLPTYLWGEMEAEAQRLLWEIHTLALAYGWSEAAILALNPARRARYLAMVRS
jgi:hypothetical protein